MAAATFLSRILGLVREQVFAAQFGASGLTDAFTIAFRLPNMLRDLFAEGAFSSAFVPIFTQEKITDPQAARRLLWALFVLLGSVTTVISLLMFIFARELIVLVTDELFTSDPYRLEVTVQLIRVMSPFLVFISLAALFMGVLNSLRVFFVPALAPAFFNIVMIASMIFFPPIVVQWGFDPIFSMGVGVLIGGCVQMLIQLPMIFKCAYGPVHPGALISSASKKIVNRLGVGTIGIAGTQINILVTTMLATSTTIGAVSWLNYAFRLFQFPVGILGVSIAGSNLVHFSDAWKSGDRARAIETLQKSYLISMVTIILAWALLFGLAQETVHLVFERGRFTSQDSVQTTLALKAYLIGLPFYGLYKILAPTFFTLDRPKIPVMISLVSVGFNIVFCLALTSRWGFVTLALGTSLSMLLNAFLQAIFLARELRLSWRFYLDLRLAKLLISGATTAWLCQYLIEAWGFYTLDGFAPKVLLFCLIGALGALSYTVSMLVLGEWKLVQKALRRGK